jgi:hypothetical protein
MVNYAAVRAVSKALNRNTQLRRQIDAQEADHQIDFGEWSGGFHDRAIERIENVVIAHVARRFGITPTLLWNDMQEAQYEETYRMVRANR